LNNKLTLYSKSVQSSAEASSSAGSPGRRSFCGR